MPPNIIEALDHPALFRGLCDGPSWANWRLFLRTLFALDMTPDEAERFRHFTGRQALPTRPFRSATVVCGRRGGKTKILGLIAAYLAVVMDHRPYLSPGEVPIVAVLAKDRSQARIALNYIVGTLKAVPVLSDMIGTETSESVTLTNGVVIEVHTASVGAPRGRTFLAVICDETAFWATGDAVNPDVEVINAIRPGLTTIPHSLLLIASSAYARRGVLYTNYARYFGKDDPGMLVWQATTVEMNPNMIGDPLIAEIRESDPERASAEFDSIFRSDIAEFVSREAVEAVLAHGVRELPAGGGITYLGHVDPSGGSADSMTLAIAHMAPDGTAVLDAIRERKPPFSPDDVVAEFCELLKLYRISRIVGDNYAGAWPRERFEKHGVHYEVSKVPASGIYSAFLPALNSRRVQLLDSARLTAQLCGLERKTSRGGRDLISHAPGGHDDVANVVSGALVRCLDDRVPALARSEQALVNDAGVARPTTAKLLYAVLAVDEAGWSAVVYAAQTFYGPRLVILDYEEGPLSGSLFADIRARLVDMIAPLHVADASAWLPEPLVPHSAAAGMSARKIPPEYEVPDGLMLSAARHIAAGDVKLCVEALAKADTSTLRAALDLRPGDLKPDPLRMALMQAIALGLDQN